MNRNRRKGAKPLISSRPSHSPSCVSWEGDTSTQRDVNLRSLKRVVSEHLPLGSVLREVVLAEPDRLSPYEFIGKVPIWLRLAEKGG